MLKCAVHVMRCTINEQPLQAEASSILDRSLSHSDNGDPWRQILIPYSCRQAPWFFYMLGLALQIYMGPTALRGIRAARDTVSKIESQVFTPGCFISQLGFEPQTFELTGIPSVIYISINLIACTYTQYGYNRAIKYIRSWRAGTYKYLNIHVRTYRYIY